jgi:hypothetical protein
MKHFFFLDQSDFLTNFLDLANSELRKQSKQASIVKLQSLLDLAIRNPGSSSSNALYKDNLKVTIASQGLYDWLIKIVSRTGGGLGDEGGELDFGSGGERFEDDATAHKTLFGMSPTTEEALANDQRTTRSLSTFLSNSHYRSSFHERLLRVINSSFGSYSISTISNQVYRQCG